MSGSPVVALDRDGTIIVERNYLADPDGVELLPGAPEGIRRLRELGCTILVVSNQSGVGRGFFDLATVERVNARMAELLAREGASIDGIYVCPHAPEEGCGCRKPRTGLLDRAAEDYGFEPSSLFVIGDNVCDMELGAMAGAITILVRTGYGARVENDRACEFHHAADDLRGAAEVIEARIAR